MVHAHENIYPVILYLAGPPNPVPGFTHPGPIAALDNPLYFELLDKVEFTVFHLDGVYDNIAPLISQPWPDYIIVADDTICHPDAQTILDAVLLQAQRGCTVILTGQFAHGNWRLMDAFFFRAGLPWRFAGIWNELWMTCNNIESNDQSYLGPVLKDGTFAACTISGVNEDQVWVCHKRVADSRKRYDSHHAKQTQTKVQSAKGWSENNQPGSLWIGRQEAIGSEVYKAGAVPVALRTVGKGKIGFVGFLEDYDIVKAFTLAMCDLLAFNGPACFKYQGYRNRLVAPRDQN